MDKQKLMRGINLLAIAFPFIFGGPTLFYFKGAKAIENGEPWWLILSILVMLIAVFYAVRGLRTLLHAIFND